MNTRYGTTVVASLSLKPGHVQPVWAGHPWIYAQAVESVRGAPEAGDEVDVVDPRGQHLGRGLYSPGSAILVRLFTRHAEPLDRELLERRVQAALALRQQLGLPSPQTSAYRLIHAEGDQLPGLIVDRFGDTLAVQFGTLGMHRLRALVCDVLMQATGAARVVDRTNPRTAASEHFSLGEPLLAGSAFEGLRFKERGLEFALPPDLAQKTGYYLDQRPLREHVERLARTGAGLPRVLDGYCFVGSSGLAAARGGAAEVVGVDTSAPALGVAAELAKQNGVSEVMRFEREDMRRYLSKADAGSFDLVLCDPPKLAATRGAKSRALDSLRKLAQAASRVCKSGGLVVLGSCSASIGLFELRRALALGARDAGKRALVLERVFQGADHPVPAAFSEGLYLTNLIARVSDD